MEHLTRPDFMSLYRHFQKKRKKFIDDIVFIFGRFYIKLLYEYKNYMM